MKKYWKKLVTTFAGMCAVLLLWCSAGYNQLLIPPEIIMERENPITSIVMQSGNRYYVQFWRDISGDDLRADIIEVRRFCEDRGLSLPVVRAVDFDGDWHIDAVYTSPSWWRDHEWSGIWESPIELVKTGCSEVGKYLPDANLLKAIYDWERFFRQGE